VAVNPNAQGWIDKADEDAAAADTLAASDPARFAGTIAYHCQQCAEKYLKAVIENAGRRAPKTHALANLIGECTVIDPTFPPLTQECNRLQPYAIDVRYPFMSPSASEASQAIADMQAVRQTCRAAMGI